MPKILLIEDNSADIILLKRAFQRRGYDIEWVELSDGETACKFIADPEFLPEIVILDINLPMVNGSNIFLQIKSSDSWRNVPVIVYSSCCPVDYFVENEVYPDAVVEKPMRLSDINRLVDKYDELT